MRLLFFVFLAIGCASGEPVPVPPQPVHAEDQAEERPAQSKRDVLGEEVADHVAAAPRPDSTAADPITPPPTVPGPRFCVSSWDVASRSEFLFIGSCDGTIHHWNVKTATRVGIFDAFEHQIVDIALSPDGSKVAVAANIDPGGYLKLLSLLEVSTWKFVWTGKKHDRDASVQYNGISDVAFSPDGTLVASTGTDSTLRVWNVADGTLVRAIPKVNEGLSFLPGSKIIVSSGGIEAYEIKWKGDHEGHAERKVHGSLVDLSAKKARPKRLGDKGAISIAISADGAIVWLDRVAWSTRTRRRLPKHSIPWQRPKDDNPYTPAVPPAPAVSSDGRFVAFADAVPQTNSFQLTIRDAKTAKVLLSKTTDGCFAKLAFAANDTLLLGQGGCSPLSGYPQYGSTFSRLSTADWSLLPSIDTKAP